MLRLLGIYIWRPSAIHIIETPIPQPFPYKLSREAPTSYDHHKRPPKEHASITIQPQSKAPPSVFYIIATNQPNTVRPPLKQKPTTGMAPSNTPDVERLGNLPAADTSRIRRFLKTFVLACLFLALNWCLSYLMFWFVVKFSDRCSG